MTVRILSEDKLEPGLIIHRRKHRGFWNRIIRGMLGSWGDHDALVIDVDGTLRIGDVIPPAARLTPIAAYNELILAGEAEVRVYAPSGVALVLEGRKASAWWLRNILNRAYDYAAYWRLFWKAVLGDWFKSAAGWTWAEWCTEGCHHAWLRGAGIDLYHNNNPTPLTTEKREGTTLVNVTGRYTEEITP